MKILLDTHMVGQRATGIERYWANLTTQLSRLDEIDELYLYCNFPSSQLLENRRLYQKKVRIFTPPVSSGIYRLAAGFSQAIHAHKPDLLHVSNFAPFFKTTPLVTTIHDLCFAHTSGTLSRKSNLAFALFLKRSLRIADAVIAVSQTVKRELLRLYPFLNQKKLYVIYEAADPCFFHLPQKSKVSGHIYKKYGLAEKYFLVVGNIQKRKNPDKIIRAFIRLLVKKKDVQLMFIGPQQDKKLLNGFRQKYSSFIDRNITFLEYIDDGELNYLYNGTRALIYYSSCEGFGLPLVEAMNCKTPIICNDVPVLKEIVSSAGIVAGTQAQLYHAMDKILSDDHFYQDCRDRSWRRRAFFSWKKAALQTKAVYQEVLKKYRSSSRQISTVKVDSGLRL